MSQMQLLLRGLLCSVVIVVLAVLPDSLWCQLPQPSKPDTISYLFRPVRSRPNFVPLQQMVGINGGTNWDSHSDPNPVKGLILNARSFHLMEIDYRYLTNPSEYRVRPCLADCDEAYTCYPDKSCELIYEKGGKSTMAYYKARYCKKWITNFPTVFASIEAITPYYKDRQCNSGGYEVRGWPDKWYTAKEWGGSMANIERNAKDYALAFAATFCPKETEKTCVVQVLEVGNEPWGEPGPEAYHAICRGTIAAMREYYGSDRPEQWRMKLSTAAFQAQDPDNDKHDYIGKMVPADLRPYFSYISLHPYAFTTDNKTLTATPESTRGQFRYIEHLDAWRAVYMPHAKLNVSEFGWNSKDNGPSYPGVGEEAQAIYLMRSLLMISRYGADKAFIYCLFDRPYDPLFNSTGLIERSNVRQKKAVPAIRKLQHVLGDKIFLKALAENDDPDDGMYAYLFGTDEGEPTHLVAWLPESITHIGRFPEARRTVSMDLPGGDVRLQEEGQAQFLAWTDDFDRPLHSEELAQIAGAGSDRQIRMLLSAAPLVIPIQTSLRVNAQGEIIGGDTGEEEEEEEGDGGEDPGETDCEGAVLVNRIIGDEHHCQPYEGAYIHHDQSSDIPSGQIVIIWQRSTDPGFSNWENLSGSYLPGLQPGWIKENTWFRRGIRRIGCREYTFSEPVLKAVGGADCAPRGCTEASVPDGFDLLGKHGDNLYYLSKTNHDWIDARASCRQFGADLVRIDDQQENDFLVTGLRRVGNSTAFIGLSDRVVENEFRWADGELPDYTNWSGSSPYPDDNADGVYLGAWSTGPWYLTHNLTEKRALCELTCTYFEQARMEIRNSWLEPTVLVYPNPVHEQVYVELIGQELKAVRLTNLNGQLLYTADYPTAGNEVEIDTEHLPAGLYILTIRTGNDRTIHRRFVKR